MPRAAVLYDFGRELVVEDVVVDAPRTGEVLVRYVASGVCRSDWHAVQGVHPCVLPAVLGHEGAGVVEAVGDGVEDVAAGDHVVLSWLPYCGRCRRCASGRPNLCERLGWSDAGTMADGTTRFHRDGRRIHHYTSSTFSELAVVPAQTAIPVDRSLPLEELALVGCAVTTGVGAVLRTAGVQPGETVAVVGCGGVGLNVVQGAAIAGAARIVAVDVQRARLETARVLGATDTVTAAPGADVEGEVVALVPGGVDHAFEALGRRETIELAIRLTCPGGTAVLVGMAAPDERVEVDALALTVGERRILGSWYGSCRPPLDFPLVVELYRAGRLRLDALVTRRCRLDEVNDAFRRMEAGEVARSVIVHG